MAEKILTFFRSVFLKNIIRKLIALSLAVIIWFLVDNTLTTQKSYNNIPVKIVNLPEGKTLEGLQPNGMMSKKISLVLYGRRSFLDRLSSSDFEVVIDAGNQSNEEWIATITKRNLFAFSPDINMQTEISRVSHKNFILKLVNLSKEKIPVFVTQPIGEPPKGYQYLDVWPYQLSLSVSGPESAIAKLKARGVKLTFNLNDISKAELENLPAHNQLQSKDVVSFFVPNDWKKVLLSTIADTPIEIDDPDAKLLRIDFIRSELIPIQIPIPISVFYSPKMIDVYHLPNYKISSSSIISIKNQHPVLTTPLYAKGVSDLFVQVVKENMALVLSFPQKTDDKLLDWSVSFINPKLLEDRYVGLLMSDMSDEEMRELQPEIRQKYLRNRFRNYMHRFEFFAENEKQLELFAEIKNNQIQINLNSNP